MNLQCFVFKVKYKLKHKVIQYTRRTFVYPYLYRSYWHSIVCKYRGVAPISVIYYAANPNPGAGIGHQMANWIAGAWYAQLLGLKFAHLPFSSLQWENFLGFSIGEVTVNELEKQGYKTRKLPLFDERNNKEITLNNKIIQSYKGKKVVLIAEQDQSYQAQYEMMDKLKEKFFSAPARQSDKLVFNKQHFNIAIHVRRGDIMLDLSNPNLAMRYLSNDYFEKVLKQVVCSLQVEKPVHIYFFSQGKPEDYPEFTSYENMHWCLDMTAQDSFLHMVYADLLITSKSSFSYKPALLSNGIKVCPRNFWHGYPDTKEWILCDDGGTIPMSQILKLTWKKQ